MMCYSELADPDSPSEAFRRRSSSLAAVHLSSGMLSLGTFLDDDDSEGNDSIQELEQMSGGDASSYFFRRGNDKDEEEDGGYQGLSKEETYSPPPAAETMYKTRLKSSSLHSLNWTSMDNAIRSVHFSTEEPEVIVIPQAELADYPLLYYGAMELQQMFNEVKAEAERSSNRTIIR